MYEVRHYESGGHDFVQEWLDGVRDQRARIAALRRIDQIESGGSGDHKYVGDGVWELRVDVGVGYRIYYAIRGRRMVLVLCGGDNRTQQADIKLARKLRRESRRGEQ